MTLAYINANILKWSRSRTDIPQQVMAMKIKVPFEKYQSWEDGIQYPTINQAMKIAHYLKIPFGYLYLSKPPIEENLPIPDFRTIHTQMNQKVSIDLQDTLDIVMRQQEWFSSFLKEEANESLTFIGSCTLEDSVERIVKDIRKHLNWGIKTFSSINSKAEYLRLLTKKCNDCGITILRNGIVGNNTHRPLQISEFRGFAICDVSAPYIFINSQDSYAAQIFTLAHEIAHLWLGESGISNINLDAPTIDEYQNIEKKCNSIAAELLVPVALLHKYPKIKDYEGIITLSREYKVSTIVILRRLQEIHKISQQQFYDYYEIILQEREIIEHLAPSTSSSGGNFYNTFYSRTGESFSHAIISSVLMSKLLYRDAAVLLNVRIPVVYKLVDRWAYA